MDGLFELMFIGLFILASIFDAVARSRRKKRRMEEMEQEEGAEESADEYGTARDWESETRKPESWERTESGSASATATREPAAEEPGSSQRSTSDDMVPDDLWAVLTGQERPTSSDSSDDRPELEASGGRPRSERELEPPEEPSIPMPVPSDRYGRGSGSGAGGIGGIGGRGTAIGHTEIGSSDGRELRPPAVDAGSLARRPVGALDDSIAALHVRRSASPYVAKLKRAGREGLREAVVLSEVLGDPVALRPGGGGWDGEPS